MKLRALDRFLLALCLLLLIAASLVTVLVGVGVLQRAFVDMFNACMSAWYNRLALCVVALVFALCALRAIVAISPKNAPAAETVTLKTTENGTIMMTMDALDTLVQKSVRGNAAVRDARSEETVGEQGEVKIRLRLNLAADAVAPEVCMSVQQGVRDYVQEKAGLNVADVEVLVNQVGGGALTRVG